ncbi:isopenicillin N synthase-like dioxygenase [Mesoflavibacter sabulilitoris]|uniref:2-oxoglutarate-dependent ethylene/succinate-forming enzyme n=1 Tax=Mesoflavibacter zeaxanthinifaciens subsp. sabulilitoris TaxID=1520893 RepID=A0A2T1NGG2_9FLAO|nr:2-oxoglutarate and iron-dependent oxygenase domain-containing protein [Mesoflavibacter zeaxanthinifaciens]MBB3122973.1 isopenicillin N synthase-like dioxygenase [Mesoflavibacter zeaxanthinifaciens subsp. sabulilitoris]PSG91957.1 flavonol synthase [Mesoflavibacter zeaxanthinifaciens subsp. sabulilitoris]
MNKIPSVNLEDFLSDDPKRKQKFVDEIGKAYEEIGFVALKGHFLDDKLVDDLYEEIKNFFELPLETKQKYEIPGIGGQRGYVSFGKESAKGKKEGDLKEFWHFGQYVEDDLQRAKEYPENVEVKEVPNFNVVGKKAYQTLEKTAKYVLRALALHLGLEETYFDNYIHNGNSILRPIHYPPITQEPDNAVRAAAHGDINLITLLMGAQGRGLQVQNHNGDWIDAIAEPDELMINVGDMLSRHTNNRLKSTIHRVVNPPRELWGTSRYSIPFFMHPISEMKLDVLDSCVDENNPKQYEDITAGEFLDQRLRELGLKK